MPKAPRVATVDEPDGTPTEEAEETAAALGLTSGYRFALEPVERLTEHPRNANRGDLASIGRSLETSGFYGAVVAQESTGFILAGNHRYRAAKERGLAKVPTIWVDVDAVGAVRIMLADNQTARLATMDLGAQDALIEELKAVDPELAGTGFDVALEKLRELEEEQRRAEEEDDSDDDDGDYPEFGARYGVIVMCRDEAHQAEVYERLAELDLGELRVVAV
jgi:ParB-like chromosome segregation protein Spo0J